MLLVFSSFEIGSLLSVKYHIPSGLRSGVVFFSACCNACYVGETTRHFSTRAREHSTTEGAHTLTLKKEEVSAEARL